MRYGQAADAAVYGGNTAGLSPNVAVVNQSKTEDEPPQVNCYSLGRDLAFGRKRFRADWPVESQGSEENWSLLRGIVTNYWCV